MFFYIVPLSLPVLFSIPIIFTVIYFLQLIICQVSDSAIFRYLLVLYVKHMRENLLYLSHFFWVVSLRGYSPELHYIYLCLVIFLWGILEDSYSGSCEVSHNLEKLGGWKPQACTLYLALGTDQFMHQAEKVQKLKEKTEHWCRWQNIAMNKPWQN